MPKAAKVFQHQRRHTSDTRPSAAHRGYDATWQRFRLAFLQEHPLCCDCLERGRSVPASEVHHVERLRERPELRLVASNCLALCKPCHTTRTNRGE
jgi:5-methylcytosine-specific restriction enzyme A